MHKVTSGEIKQLTVDDCRDGEYVFWKGRHYRVAALVDADKMRFASSLDGTGTIYGDIAVERVPPGTVITIVVGGEKPDDATPQYTGHSFRGHEILLEHKSDDTEVATEFRQRYGDFITSQSDAEFLDSLREREYYFQIETNASSAYDVTLHAMYDIKTGRADTFAEAVQWLREKAE